MSEVDVYIVRADRETGEWLGEPQAAGLSVNLYTWNHKLDTHATHYDTYDAEVDGRLVTRALVVLWAGD